MADANELAVESLTRRMAELEVRMDLAEGVLRTPLGRIGLPPAPPRQRPAPPPLLPLPRVVALPEPAEPAQGFPVVVAAPKVEQPHPSDVLATPHDATAPPEPGTVPPRRATRGGVSLEARIGKNLAGWVGAIVLVLGVGFFLRYAWQHEWIHPSPLGRVVFAVLVGLGLGGLGEWLYRRPMRGLAGVLYAAAVAVVMAAFFAAHAYFAPPVIGRGTASVMVCLTAAGGIALALRADLPAVAILALLGAYLAPIVLRSGADQSAALVAYLLVLAGVGWTLCLTRPRWAGLRAFTFAASWVWYTLWYMTVGQHAGHAALAMTYLAVVYAGTLGEVFLSTQRATERNAAEAAVLSLASSLLTAIALYVLYRANQPLVGTLLLGMAAVQAIVALSTPSRQIRYSAVLQSAALVTMAVPLLLSQFAINLAWLVMGVALGTLNRRVEARWLRPWAAALWVLAVAKLALLDFTDPALRGVLATVGAQPLTHWLLTAWGTAVVGHALAFLGRRGQQQEDPLGAALAVGGTALFLAATAAAWGAGGGAWTLAALLWSTAVVGLREQGTRIGYVPHAWGLLALVAVKWALADGLSATVDAWSAAAADVPPIANLVVLNGALLCGLFAWLRAASAGRVAKLTAGVAAGAIAFALANFEACRTLNFLGHGWDPRQLAGAKQVALSVLWAATALAAITVGFGRRVRAARYAGLALLGVTLLKVLTVDMAGVETVWRILSFTAVGGLLLCVSFVYYKHLEDKASADRSAEPREARQNA